MKKLEYTQDKLAGGASPEQVTRVVSGFPDLQLNNNIHATLPVLLRRLAAGRSNGFGNIIADSPASPNAKDRLRVLFRMVGEQSALLYPVLKNSIMRFESEVASAPGLSADDRQLLLKAASITRYSAWYWTYKEPVPAKNLKLKDFFRWVAIVTEDIAGLVASEVKGNSLGEAATEAAAGSRAADLFFTYGVPEF